MSTPLANTIIPKPRRSSQAAKLYEFEPLPNSPSESAPNAVPLRNFRETLHSFSNKDQFHLRADWGESSKSAWFGRFSWTDEGLFNPGLYPSGGQTAFNAKQAMLSKPRSFSPAGVDKSRIAR